MDAGELAPDALVTEAIRPILMTRDDYVLDGFPRRLAQAEGVDFDIVVFLDVPLDVVKQRLLARGRADDTADVIENRLREYDEDTQPLIDHYRDKGVLLRVDGDRPPDEIAAELREKLLSHDATAWAGPRASATARAQRLDHVLDQRVFLAGAHRGDDLPRRARGRAPAARRRRERELTSAIVGISATPIPDAAMPCSAW